MGNQLASQAPRHVEATHVEAQISTTSRWRTLASEWSSIVGGLALLGSGALSFIKHLTLLESIEMIGATVVVTGIGLLVRTLLRQRRKLEAAHNALHFAELNAAADRAEIDALKKTRESLEADLVVERDGRRAAEENAATLEKRLDGFRTQLNQILVDKKAEEWRLKTTLPLEAGITVAITEVATIVTANDDGVVRVRLAFSSWLRRDITYRSFVPEYVDLGNARLQFDIAKPVTPRVLKSSDEITVELSLQQKHVRLVQGVIPPDFPKEKTEIKPTMPFTLVGSLVFSDEGNEKHVRIERSFQNAALDLKWRPPAGALAAITL